VRYALAVAASALVVLSVPVLLSGSGGGTNRLKGSSNVEMVVAGAANGPQRAALPNMTAPEALAPGERVRVGYSVDAHRFMVVVSVDERGEITSFPDRGSSTPIDGKAYLPDSIEFTGHGLEHVVVVLTPEPLSVDEVRRAVRVRYDEARGNLNQLGSLDLPGDQFHWTFLKP
jgi:hypothetical protein